MIRTTTDTPSRRWRRFAAAIAAAAMLAGVGAMAPAGASAPGGAQAEPSCPSTVDTRAEGWICSQLILATPAVSPSEAQIDLWMTELETRGRTAVAQGILFSDASIENKVRVLYRTQLHRSAEASAVDYWSEVFQDARSELNVELPIFQSGEYLSQFESVEAFVVDQYEYYLGRQATRNEQQYWATLFANDEEVSNDDISYAIATSAEAGDVRARILYAWYLGRDADTAGFDYWSDRAATLGLYRSVVDIVVYEESFVRLGQRGMALAD